jgi:hypothetical protein
MSGVTFNWYTLGGALIIAAAAATFAYYRYLQEQKHQRSTLLNALFSEIANIYEHYSYAAHEIPTTLEDEFEIQKRLRWSSYGKISSISDIEKLGFLSALNIKALLQLGLLIRNDDMLLQQLQEKKEEITPERLKYLKTASRIPKELSLSLLSLIHICIRYLKILRANSCDSYTHNKAS